MQADLGIKQRSGGNVARYVATILDISFTGKSEGETAHVSLEEDMTNPLSHSLSPPTFLSHVKNHKSILERLTHCHVKGERAIHKVMPSDAAH